MIEHMINEQRSRKALTAYSADFSCRDGRHAYAQGGQSTSTCMLLLFSPAARN